MSKKTRFLIPVLAAAAFFYIILAAKTLPKEIQLKPEWTVDIDSASLPSGDEQIDYTDAVPFKLGQTLGSISKDGKLLNRISFPYKAASSEQYYALYGTSSETIDFFTLDGKKAGTIHGSGFPYFADDKKCLFLPGGSSFAFLAEDGSRLWDYAEATPITAFSTSKNGIAAGFANGKVVAFNNDGDIIQEYKPGGSTYEVIYGVGISDSTRYTATLSGQDNQRFVISEKLSDTPGANSSIIFYKTLTNELNRQAIVKFTKDEKNVYYDAEDGVGLVNLKTLTETMIPIKGRILSIKESEDGRQVFILSREKGTRTVSVIEGFGILAGSFSFDAASSCIVSSGNALFVGRDSKISKITIERK